MAKLTYLALLLGASLTQASSLFGTNVCFHSCCQYYNPLLGSPSCACAPPGDCWAVSGAPVYTCQDPTYGITCIMAVSMAPNGNEPEKAFAEALEASKKPASKREEVPPPPPVATPETPASPPPASTSSTSSTPSAPSAKPSPSAPPAAASPEAKKADTKKGKGK